MNLKDGKMNDEEKGEGFLRRFTETQKHLIECKNFSKSENNLFAQKSCKDDQFRTKSSEILNSEPAIHCLDNVSRQNRPQNLRCAKLQTTIKHKARCETKIDKKSAAPEDNSCDKSQWLDIDYSTIMKKDLVLDNPTTESTKECKMTRQRSSAGSMIPLINIITDGENFNPAQKLQLSPKKEEGLTSFEDAKQSQVNGKLCSRHIREDGMNRRYSTGQQEDVLSEKRKQNGCRWSESKNDNQSESFEIQPQKKHICECRCNHRSKEKVTSWLLDDQNRDYRPKVTDVVEGKEKDSPEDDASEATVRLATKRHLVSCNNQNIDISLDKHLSVPMEHRINSQSTLGAALSLDVSSRNFRGSQVVSSLNNTVSSVHSLMARSSYDPQMGAITPHRQQSTFDNSKIGDRNDGFVDCSNQEEGSILELFQIRSYSMKTLTDIKERLPLLKLSSRIAPKNKIMTTVRRTVAGLEIEKRACAKAHGMTMQLFEKPLNIELVCSLPPVKNRTINWVENQRLLQRRLKV